jgi:hypothetical protein
MWYFSSQFGPRLGFLFRLTLLPPCTAECHHGSRLFRKAVPRLQADLVPLSLPCSSTGA